MEIILPATMKVAESYDIALELQHKIESLSEVERAFVHVDHQRRNGLKHKVERELRKALEESVKSSGKNSKKGENSSNDKQGGKYSPVQVIPIDEKV